MNNQEENSVKELVIEHILAFSTDDESKTDEIVAELQKEKLHDLLKSEGGMINHILMQLKYFEGINEVFLSENHKLHQEVDKLKTTSELAQEELSKIQQKLKNSYEDYNKKVESLQVEIKNQCDQITSLESENWNLGFELNSLKEGSIKETQKHTKALAKLSTDLNEKQKELDAIKTELDATKADYEQKIEQNAYSIQELTAEKDSLQKLNGEFVTGYNNTSDKIVKYKATIKDQEAKISKLLEELNLLKESKTKLATLEQDLQTLNKQQLEQVATIHSLEIDLNKSKSNYDELHQETEKQININEELQSLLNAAKQNNDELTKELAKVKQQNLIETEETNLRAKVQMFEKRRNFTQITQIDLLIDLINRVSDPINSSSSNYATPNSDANELSDKLYEEVSLWEYATSNLAKTNMNDSSEEQKKINQNFITQCKAAVEDYIRKPKNTHDNSVWNAIMSFVNMIGRWLMPGKMAPVYAASKQLKKDLDGLQTTEDSPKPRRGFFDS